MGAYCKCDVVNGAVPVAAADTAFLLRGRDEPEVRHLHHDRDHAQHDSDGSRALRAVGRVRERALRRQHRIHRHLHHRVCAEANQSALVLLQAGVERVRLRRCRRLRPRSVQFLALPPITYSRSA